MVLSKKQIKDYLHSADYRPLKVRDLAKSLKIPADQYRKFSSMVKEMVSAGELSQLRRGRISPPEEVETIRGSLAVTKSGKAFVIPEDGNPDLLIMNLHRVAALDGDTVLVRQLSHQSHSKPSGEIVGIVERRIKQVVGTYHHTRYHSIVIPDSNLRLPQVIVEPPKSMRPKEGAKVVVSLLPWEDPERPLEGLILHVLGATGDPGVDILSIIYQLGLSESFSAGALAEAARFPAAITRSELERRRDLRRLVSFTIDPEDAKDHDDAVSLEKTDVGYRLGVHIADVSHYVTDHSHLDREARHRSFSVYFPDRVLPMLPERLSNDLCSLKEHEDRLALSVVVDLTAGGDLVNYEIAETVIHSHAKLTYDEVQQFLDSGNGFEQHKRIGTQLRHMETIAKALMDKRMREGSIDFELPEYKVKLDESGHTLEIRKRARMMSSRMIEEFMLLANRVVAHHLLSKNIPALYRVHPPPDDEKLDSFVAFAESLGHKASFGSPPQARLIARFLERIHGSSEDELLNELLVRSMQKAFYQPENIGHFGLAFPHYLHFTSPIRRYPDLIVHRILKEQIQHRFQLAKAGNLKGQLARIGARCSQQELVVMAAEQTALKVKQADYLSRQLGEIYEGVISGVIKFGFFVRLVEIGADGLVRLSTLEDDYYVADVDKLLITGRRTRRRFRFGDRVQVQVVNVSLPTGEIDLQLIEEQAKKPGLRARRIERQKL